jgi:hypothetical protein
MSSNPIIKSKTKVQFKDKSVLTMDQRAFHNSDKQSISVCMDEEHLSCIGYTESRRVRQEVALSESET